MEQDFLKGVDNLIVYDAFVKAQSVLRKYKKVLVSISGGSDSDIVLDIMEKCKTPDNEIIYVWFDTGVEYQATKDHLVYLEERYGIKIEREKAIKSIPTCCREYGQPFVSKYVSEYLGRLQRQGFNWEDEPYEVLCEKYPKVSRDALGWWSNIKSPIPNSQFNIGRNKWLKEFIVAFPPNFKIDSKCCAYAKKKVGKLAEENYKPDLKVTGVRQAEGGIRAVNYDGCLTIKDNGISAYRPIFWFTDADKRYYEDRFNIRHSDCYTKYGLYRTGCVGCPYSRDHDGEMKAIEIYEPKLAKACNTMFKDSYEYTRKYRAFYAVMQGKKKNVDGQMDIYDFYGERA